MKPNPTTQTKIALMRKPPQRDWKETARLLAKLEADEKERRRHLKYWAVEALMLPLELAWKVIEGIVMVLIAVAGIAYAILCLLTLREAVQWFFGTGRHRR